METKDMRVEFKIGIGILAATIFASRYLDVSELALGFLFGIAICFEVVGALPDRIYYKIKSWKKNIVK